MKKKFSLVIAAIAASLAFTACGGGISEPTTPADPGPENPGNTTTTGGDGPTTVLRYSTQHTENTPFSRATERWADLVNERTEGRVSVEMFYSASLLPAAEVLPGIMDGRASAGFVVDTMFADLLPLTNASSIPFDRMNGVAQARAYQEIYDTNEDYRAEFEDLGVHVLMFQPPGATVIGTSSEVTSLDDLSGMSIRCLGYICDSLQAVGANPVAIASNEIYEAMDRDTINGWAAYPFMDMLATQFQEVTSYVTDPGIGAYIQGFSPINLDVWNSLEEADREALTELAHEYYDIMAEEMNNLERETCEATTAAGVELSELSEADVQAWRDAVHDDVYQKWVNEASGSAHTDPEAFYTDLMAAYETALENTTFESLYTDCVNNEIG